MNETNVCKVLNKDSSSQSLLISFCGYELTWPHRKACVKEKSRVQMLGDLKYCGICRFWRYENQEDLVPAL